MKNQFELRLLSTGWMEDLDEKLDLCAHGKVLARIGPTILSDSSSDSTWTVSAAALYFLRTLTLDHTPGAPVGDQLLPCCGFAMWVDAATESDDVFICGCPNGVDWSVEHVGEEVRLTAIGDESVVLAKQEYQAIVLQFVDAVYAFYQSSKPKEPSADPEDAAGYEAFWREWHRRYQQFRP